MTNKLFKFVLAVMCLGWLNVANAQTYSHEPASAIWSFTDESDYEAVVVNPEAGIAVASVNIGDAQLTGNATGNEGAVDSEGNKVTFIKVKPKNGATDVVEWYVKPTQGVTFTPTKISMYIQRFGTDAQNGVTVSAAVGEGGESITLGNYTAPRNNKTKDADKYGSAENYTNKVEIELSADQQAALASGEGFHLYTTIGVGNSKEGGFSDVRIEGFLDGSLPTVKVDNEAGYAFWKFEDEISYVDVTNAEPEGYFSITSFNLGDATVSGAATGNENAVDSEGNKIKFVKIKPANGSSDIVEWFVKPAQGLVFTPTKIEMDIQRFGTDSQNGVTISAAAGEGMESITLGNYTAPRNNKSQADDKYGSAENYGSHVVIELTAEQQAALASGEGLHLYSTIGVNSGKEGGFANIRISGVFNGELIKVTKYTLNLTANPEEAGSVAVRPSATEFEAGSKVTISTTRNFGYKFLNWTDAAGNVVAETPEFEYTMDANAAFVANYDVIPTYSLNVNVEGGANTYMVQLTPAPEVVDNKNMYEEGTTVSLTAMSNPIMKFTNWSDGQSSGEISMVMDSDKEITATYTAEDFVVGWDFWRKGANGRLADFYSADNDAASINLRNADGDIDGWLDKSQEAANGYEGRPAAVNWRTSGIGDFYWETKVNASAFTDMKLITAMLYNYNAYTTQNVEYSIDGKTWSKIGAVKMEGAKNWTDAEFELPAEANNQQELYIRWISDKTSSIDGTSSSNDGIALGASYLLGKLQMVDDGTAPKLVSFVPEEGSNTASINGKVVLTFDEKVKMVGEAQAELNGAKLTAEVTGKTVVFPYKGLAFGTDYTFVLAANSVSDLTDNVLSEAIKINFTTKTRPVVAKGEFDFIVPDNGSFQDAIAAAEKREDVSKRFRVFIRNGEYKLPASATNKKNGNYPDPTTYLNTSNVSFIGESVDGVVITNTLPENPSVLEGIGIGDVFDINSGVSNTYMQNLTMKSSMGDKKGRDIVLNDKGDKTICKDICLWGYQDTYVSNTSSSRYYFEGGVLRGRTDFLCGKGDVYYKGVTLQMVGAGYLAVPSTPRQYGYVFKDCEIVGEVDRADGDKDPDGQYTLGRPWGEGTPIALFIDTKMTARPSAIGWSDMGNDGHPARFAEYNSFTATGTPIDLSQRKTTFGPGNHTNNPVLTKEEADAASYEAVMGSDDDWDPASVAEQAPLPANVKTDGITLTWDDNDYVFCWAVCENGKVVAFTTEPYFDITNSEATYSVRSANEMGGLGEAVGVGGGSVGVDGIYGNAEVVETIYFDLCGTKVASDVKGVLIKVEKLSDGRSISSKVINF